MILEAMKMQMPLLAPMSGKVILKNKVYTCALDIPFIF